MKWVIACFALAMAVTATVSLAISASRAHHDPSMHAVHYDNGYDLSSQRRMHQQ